MALTRGMMGTGRRTGRARSRSMGLRVVGGGHASEKVAARSGGGRRKRPGGMPEVALAGWAGMSLRDSPWGCPVDGSGTDGAPSGWQGNGAQSGQGVSELGFPGPALGQMQGEAACGVGEASGDGEEAPPEGLGGYQLLAQTDARCPAGQVMRHHLDGQPGPLRQAQDWRRNGLTGDG